MKVRITFDVSDDTRRAVRWSWGRPGPATRVEMSGWIEATANAAMELLVSDFLKDEQLQGEA